MRSAAALFLVICLTVSACGGGGGAGEDGAPAGPTALVNGTPVALPTPLPTATPVPADAIVIGSLLAESGVMASIETPLLRAAQDEIRRLEENGLLGRPLVLAQVDSQSRQSVLYDQTVSLVEGGAQAIVVGCEQEFLLAVRDALDRLDREVLLLSPCGADRAWQSGDLGDLAFSFAVPAGVEGQVMAERGRAEGHSRAALLIDSSAGVPVQQCDGFAERWRQLGGTIATEQELTFADASVLGDDPEALRESLGGSDLLVVCANPVTGVPILKGVRGAGVATSIIAGSTMAGGWLLGDVADLGRFEVVAYASIAGDDPSEQVVALVDRYFGSEQRLPDSGQLVTGADVIDAYTRAVTAGGSTDPGDVARAMEAFDGESLVSGPLTFSSASHIAAGRTLRVLEAEGPRLVFVESRVAGQ